MPLNENDLSYLVDIVHCIADIKEFTSSISYNEFEKDKMRKLAVERQLEIIGQAANKTSKETQDAPENIPWGKIIGLRNKLAHDYGEILAERIWNISKASMQELLNELEKRANFKIGCFEIGFCGFSGKALQNCAFIRLRSQNLTF